MKLGMEGMDVRWLARAATVVVVLSLLFVWNAVATPRQAHAQRITATCSNTESDASTINAAIESSQSGDEIVIDGPCLINQVIKLLGDRSYTGQSRTGTVLKQANGANLPEMVASDSYLDNSSTTGLPVAVRQLTLDGNRANNTAQTSGIVLRSWQSVLEDLHIADMGGNGIRLTSVSANGTRLTNTQVNGRIVGNFIENSGQYGVFIEDPVNSVTDWELTDNWIASSGIDGIHMDNAAGWVVERNHIYGVPQNAIYANRLYGTAISDNYIEGFGETSQSGTWYGINATVQGDAASTISDNRVFNFDGEKNPQSTYRYIGLSKVNYNSGVVSVTGNVIRGAGTARGMGLYYSTGDKGQGVRLTVTSTGNAVINVHKARYIGFGVTVNRGF